jgi:hypothetical protein
LASPYFKRLGHLRGKITTFAYEKIKVELTLAWQYDNTDSCDCIVRHVYKLPCRHVLPKEAIVVPIDMVDKRWVIGEESENVTDDLNCK